MHPNGFIDNEAQINAAEQAKELRVETCTEANVDETHESRRRHMVAIMDEEDAKTVLDVLVVKHPFVIMDTLSGILPSIIATAAAFAASAAQVPVVKLQRKFCCLFLT